MATLILQSGAISATGPGSAFDTSVIGGAAYTVTVNGQASNLVRIGVEDSVDGTNFLPFAVWAFAASPGAAQHATSYDAPGLATAAGCKARLNVYKLAGTANFNVVISWPG